MSLKRRIMENGEKMDKVNTSEKVDKKTFLIAQEIQLAKVLAGNNQTLRNRALRRLKRWLEFRSKSSPFTEEDFMRIWKGLFYTMWMSDKPLFQEECAEMISSLVHFNDSHYSLLFLKCGLKTLGNEWFGIDQLRLDKFLMFVRRLLRQGFVILRKNDWDLKTIKQFNGVLSATVLNMEKSPPIGLVMHFTEIYLEELAKISEGNLKPNLVTEFVSPFIKQLAVSDDNRQIKCISKNLFHYLMQQSELGMEYEKKFKDWKDQGFPGGCIDAMQKQDVSDEEIASDDEENPINENSLDPRAGHVDVVLPQLKFIPKHIISILSQNRFGKGTNSKSRKAISTAIDEFTQFSKGQYPFGLKRIELIKDRYSTKTKNAVNRLVKFEKKLLNRDNKKRKRKHKEIHEDVGNKKRRIETASNEKLEEFIKKSEGDIKINCAKNERKNKRRLTKDKDRKKQRKIVLNSEREIKIEERTKILTNSKKFIKSKRVQKVKKKSISDEPDHKNYECAFERNSGTWFVYDDDSSTTSSVSNQESTPEPPPIKGDGNVTKLNGEARMEPKQTNKVTTESPKRITPIRVHENVSPKNNLFQLDEWNTPLKEGETEIFVESKKYKKRKLNRSLDSKIVKNPFAQPMTPGSCKKVKIALNLNKAQDIKEHVAQIKSSPGIPFDADKKPLKPLLKRTSISPINPFYRKTIL